MSDITAAVGLPIEAARGNGSPTAERIFDVATELFAERGYHATTVREIGLQLGIKAASLYNHYPHKHAILLEIASSTMTQLLEGGRQAVAAHETPSSQLHALVSWHVIYHARNRLRCRVADEELRALRPEDLEVVLPLRDAYEQLFKDVLAAGERQEGWRIPNVAVVAFAIATMCTAVVTWFHEDGELTAEELGAMYADLALSAVGAGPS